MYLSRKENQMNYDLYIETEINAMNDELYEQIERDIESWNEVELVEFLNNTSRKNIDELRALVVQEMYINYEDYRNE